MNMAVLILVSASGVCLIAYALFWVLSGRMLAGIHQRTEVAGRITFAVLLTALGLGGITAAVFAAVKMYTAEHAVFHVTDTFKFEYASYDNGGEVIVTYTDTSGAVHTVSADAAVAPIEVGDVNELTYFAVPNDKTQGGVISVKVSEDVARDAGYPYEDK